MKYEMLKKLVDAAKDKKAERVVVLDLQGKSDICDYQLICSAATDRQTKAIASHIDKVCRADLKLTPASIEGVQTGHWILLDYGSLMVHVFMGPMRDYYALESLWPGAIMNV
ncbi:MAG: ribosome silencing factor [Zetaproteobacteria bacterium]|nr:ribosome silencing factor [Zetaproteobacteria bacterium]